MENYEKSWKYQKRRNYQTLKKQPCRHDVMTYVCRGIYMSSYLAYIRALRDGARLGCGLVAFAFCVALSSLAAASPGLACGVPRRDFAEHKHVRAPPNAQHG